MRRALVTAIVLAPLLALGACGDDDGSSDASTSSSGGSGDSGGSVADSFRDDAIVTDGARDTGRDGDGPEVDASTDADAAPDATDGDDASDGGDAGTCRPRPSTGLMTRSKLPTNDAAHAFIDTSVLELEWADVEPTRGTFDWTVLESTLAAASARHFRSIKLRIFGGAHPRSSGPALSGGAPTWARKLGSGDTTAVTAPPGGSTNTLDRAAGCVASSDVEAVDCCASGGGIPVVNVQDVAGCSPFFWTNAYLTAYGELLDELRLELARAPHGDLVTEVVDSACQLIYAEPFYRGQNGTGGTNRRLAELGLGDDIPGSGAYVAPSAGTVTFDRYCHERAIVMHHQKLPCLITSLAVNPWDLVERTRTDDAGTYRLASWTATHDFLEWARTVTGDEWLLLQNNGLGEPAGDNCTVGAPGSYWCYIKSWPGPRGFQTESWPRLGSSGANLKLAIQHGLDMRALFVELPANWESEAGLAAALQVCDAAPTGMEGDPGTARTCP